MSLERTDLRFLLSRAPRTVALLGELAGAAEAFALVGLEVVDGPADLVVAPAGMAAQAVRLGGAVALEGAGGARALARAGAASRRLLALPDTSRPAHVLPLDRPRILRYGVRHLAGRSSRVKAVRNRVAPLLLGLGPVPPARALAVAPGGDAPPFLVAAAREAGVPVADDCFWSTGSSDVLSRGVLSLFPPDARLPQWVLKFGRVPGARAAFERDAAGLAVAARAGGAAACHAPRLLAALEAGGAPASVEIAAAGERLLALLESSAPARVKRAAVERIAAWIVDVGRETAARPPAIAAELDRLRHDVLPAWALATPAVLDGLDALPAVMQHNDLGTWNLLVTADGFTAVDWESARPAGLPLWDLVYFLSYAILGLDGVGAADQERHLVDTYLGRTSSSALLFAWIRRAVKALALDADLVGRLALTGWLHHGLSHVARDDAVRSAGGEPATAATTLPRRLASRWLHEPGLGVGWDRWRR